MAFSRILKSSLVLICRFFYKHFENLLKSNHENLGRLEFLQPFTAYMNIFGFPICEYCAFKMQAKEGAICDVPIMVHSCL